MNLNQFLQERRPRWQQLERLLDRVEREGLESLSPREADQFFAVYRLVSSDLNLVQTRTANPALLEYLEGLVGRAYANLAIADHARPLRAWWRIVRYDFPALIRSEVRILALAAAVLAAGIAFGFLATWVTPETADVFLPPTHTAVRPSERVAQLEAMEEKGQTRIDTAGKHALFTSFLMTHNIRVTIFGFALGFTFGIGTVIILFYNGALLGSLMSLYFQDGVGTFFVAWVGPHGAIELPCILFGCTAGLMLARAQFRRDRGSLMAQLRLLRRPLVQILIGTATLLGVAALVEGGFSQVNEPTLPYELKIAVAGALFLALIFYLFWMPVRKKQSASGIDQSI